MAKIYFSDFFEVDQRLIEKYGAFNVSLINDLPLFIDPFLLFNSKEEKYRVLHDRMITYLRFLRDRSASGSIEDGLIKAWYTFPEVKQTWLGFTTSGNKGSGLGQKFAFALNENLGRIFSDFGNEQITKGSHLEKLCLIRKGVGKDNISDFTTNLIKEFLLEYTQELTQKHIKPEFRKVCHISKIRFNYDTEVWEGGRYDLPYMQGDYVLLTPIEILTKGDTWINKTDLIDEFDRIPNAIPNEQQRALLNNYFRAQLTAKSTRRDERLAAFRTIQAFPELIDFYIKYKEDNGDQAINISAQKVTASKHLYVEQFKQLAELLSQLTEFYSISGTTYEEARKRVEYLKDVIENNDGYRIFYLKNGQPLEREEDLQILYKLTWYATPSDVNREVNNGRGPVDFSISRGGRDKTLVEFKLAKNSHLERNLQKQVAIYEKASNAQNSLKVIIYFTEQELYKVATILRKLGLYSHKDIILIDARKDNKPSASKA